MTQPYKDSIYERIDELVPGASASLEKMDQSDHPNAVRMLGAIITRACGSAKVHSIVEGREAFGRLPKPWLEKHLPEAISRSVDFSDDWEYRRLLELLDEHFPKLLEKYSKMGLNSEDESIREAAAFGMRQLKEEHGGIYCNAVIITETCCHC